MHFITRICSLVPHIHKDELISLYNNCYPTCSVVIHNKVCTNDCMLTKTHCEKHILCTHLIQSGKRKGTPCHKVNCATHKGVVLCSRTSQNEPCLHSCEEGETICMFHKKEDEMYKELSRPIVQVRIHESGYFVIKDTLVVIDIEKECIQGTLYIENGEWVLRNNESNQCKEICTLYNLPFSNNIDE
jgi:hypothetical protein